MSRKYFNIHCVLLIITYIMWYSIIIIVWDYSKQRFFVSVCVCVVWVCGDITSMFTIVAYTSYVNVYTKNIIDMLWSLILVYLSINIGYTMKRRGIRDLDHRGNHLILFPRWSKSRIPQLFHRIRYLYYTSLSVCLSVTAKYYSRVLEAYRSRQDRRHWRPANILGQRVIWKDYLDDNTRDRSVALLLSCRRAIGLSLRRQCCSLL